MAHPAPSTPNRQRAVILLRASMNAEDRTTLLTQDHECQSYASSHGMTVVATFTDDGKSGYKPGTPRPGFDAAMKMIERGQADVLIVWKLDRLVRNLMSFMETWQKIQKAGGEFVSVVEQWDTTTLMGKLMLMIVAAFAEMESEMKRDRAIPHHQYRKRNGLPPGGPRPFGYVRVNGTLEVAEHEAAIMREMAALVLAGKSLTHVHQVLKAVGSKDVPLTLRGIKRMLTSPTTAGLRELDGDYVQGVWTPILNRSQWEQVRAVLGDPGRRTNFHTQGTPAHLLTGFAQCSDCKVNMVRKSHPKGLRLLCRECNSSLPMKVADDAVTLWLMDNIDAQAWKNLKEQGRGYDPDVVAALEAEKLEVAQMKAAGEIDLSQFRVLNADLNARLAAAHDDTPLDLPDISDLQSGWDTLDLAGQRTIIMTLLESVEIDKHSASTQGRDRVMIERAV